MNRLGLLAAITVLGLAPLEAQQFGAYSAIHNGEIFISEPFNQNEPATIYIYRRGGGGWIRSFEGDPDPWDYLPSGTLPDDSLQASEP